MPVRRASPHAGDVAMSKARDILERVQDKRKQRLLVIVSHSTLDRIVTYEVASLLRRMGDVENLDVMLDSGGGDLDAAFKTLKIIKLHAKDTTMIVPFYAKSAATLIALGGDNLVLCKGGELGPVDPQVLDFSTGRYVPVSSIKETVDFLEGIGDQIIKASLTEKIPTLMVGAYKASAKASKQYLAEVLADRNLPNTKALIDTFTEKFFSHGYPMDVSFLKKNGIDVSSLDDETESMFYELLDCYMDATRAGDESGGVTIIHSDVGHTVIHGGNPAARILYKGKSE